MATKKRALRRVNRIIIAHRVSDCKTFKDFEVRSHLVQATHSLDGDD
jgi:hypothetical protein